MPELPDVEIYRERLCARIAGHQLDRIRLQSPFVLRSVEPTPSSLEGLQVDGVSRLGKRLIVELDGDRFAVIHLMVAGRLRWRPRGAPIPRRGGLCAFDFSSGTVQFTEMAKKKRASLHLVEGRAGLLDFDRGGLEVQAATLEAFAAALGRENHTLKRALTDPRILSGIGNAYSDEILHRARLSPFQQTRHLDTGTTARLLDAARAVLSEWTERLRAEVGDGFPEKVTAFREEMAVHGKFRQPCPTCGAPIQRVVYTENEANYCARCQTGGKVLADRALSRLLKKNWPRTLEELELQSRFTTRR